MVQLWRAGFDMVYGVLADCGHESRLKRWCAGLFYSIMESRTIVGVI